MWRKSYHAHPYLKNRPQAFVDDRFRYTFENILTLNADGKIGFEGMKNGVIDPDGTRHWVNFTHLMEEYAARGLGFPTTSLGPTPPVLPGVPQAQSVYASRTRKEPGKLFRFGKEHHLRDALEHGRIRLAPAAGYKDPSLNRAVRDDEMTFRYHLMPSDVNLTLPDGTRVPVPTDVPDVSFTLPHDFLVLCLSTGFHLRLFRDFDANACLIIYDEKRFVTAITEAAKLVLPDFTFATHTVAYIDPCCPPKTEPPMPFAKHLRYWYQHEYRAVAMPTSARTLAPIVVDIGPMQDYTELITNTTGVS